MLVRVAELAGRSIIVVRRCCSLGLTRILAATKASYSALRTRPRTPPFACEARNIVNSINAAMTWSPSLTITVETRSGLSVKIRSERKIACNRLWSIFIQRPNTTKSALSEHELEMQSAAPPSLLQLLPEELLLVDIYVFGGALG
jgi:hypothetical protein